MVRVVVQPHACKQKELTKRPMLCLSCKLDFYLTKSLILDVEIYYSVVVTCF